MKKLDLSKFTRYLGKARLKLSNASPELLAIVGVVGLIAAGVTACVASTKLGKTLDEVKDDIDKVKSDENPEVVSETKDVERKKALFKAYLKGAGKICKLYIWSVLIAAISIACIFTSNKILRNRLTTVTAAYAMLDKAYKSYREDVAKEIGEEKENELYYGVKKVTEEVVDPETGEKKQVEHLFANTEHQHSIYAKYFDECSDFWKPDPLQNLAFLNLVMASCNDKLKNRGYLFLNEVYEMLDIPPTVEGQIIGWVYDEDNPIGDNFVDFGLHNGDAAARRFVNGYEPVILLDFNVDGDVRNSFLAAAYRRH